METMHLIEEKWEELIGEKVFVNFGSDSISGTLKAVSGDTLLVITEGLSDVEYLINWSKVVSVFKK